MAGSLTDRDKAFGKVFGNSKYSDLTIRCGDREWRVHKAIVRSQSSVIEAAIDHAWQESASDTTTNTEFDAATFQHFLSYLYTSDYTIPRAAQSLAETEETASTGEVILQSTQSTLVGHVLVYAIADYYDVKALKALAASRFTTLLNYSWSAEGSAEVIEAVCRHTPAADQSLRSPLILTIVEHLAELRQDGDIIRLLTCDHDVQALVLDMLLKLDDYRTSSLKQQEETMAAHAEKIQGLEQSLASKEHTLNSTVKSVMIEVAKKVALIQQLQQGEMSKSCGNVACKASFNPVVCEEKGNGEWRIRCGRCSARVIH